ncbi:MAG: YbfB/YjiJ family MFS transporter [Magnetovibrio sp.]|nr:YbfB/YjiJ family MFS transporter [Magnetovibrio sp.]
MSPAAASEEGVPNWRRIAIGGGAAMFVGIALGRFSYTTMLPALIQSGQLTELEAGYVGGGNLVAFFAGAFFAEHLRRRVSVRLLLPGVVWLGVLALVASALPWGFLWLLLWRGLLGAIAGLIMVQSIAFATAAAPPDKRPVAAGYVYAGVGLGIFLSGSFSPWLLDQGIAWAWSGFALAGLLVAGIAQWGWSAADILPTADPDAPPARLPRHIVWRGLVAANFLFSFGIVPHTIYWVDFLVRDVGYSMELAGLHWSTVGISAFLGPVLCAAMAARIGISPTLLIVFVLLGIGVGGPAFLAAAPMLWYSSIFYGGQPGLAAVMAARARDMGSAADMPRMMRVTILSNACGAAAGGLALPLLFELSGGYEILFVLGGGAMLLGALCTLPRRIPT